MKKSTNPQAEQAREELGSTQVSPRLAYVMSILFVVGLGASLIFGRALWGLADGEPGALPVVPAAAIEQEVKPQTGRDWFGDALAANNKVAQGLEAFEQRFTEQTWATNAFQPMQPWLVRLTGLATESVCAGQNGWLFFKPGIDHVTGPGFLNESSSADSTASERRRLCPIAAIIDFQQQLAQRDIDLIVMPVPVKPMVHPEQMSASFQADASRPLRNRSDAEFERRLTDAGVEVFDVTNMLVEQAIRAATPQFLKTDTHWTADAVNLVSAGLASRLQSRLGDRVAASTWHSKTVSIEGIGDLAAMLGAGEASQAYPPETVGVRRIESTSGAPWKPTAAEVLVLGDSFTNIYSLAEMNWGDSAGLAEQLSFHLQRPVDRIAQNDQGAIASRQAFARVLARDPQRFATTRVVVWQFAARELSLGDWRIVPLPTRAIPSQPRTTSDVASDAVEVTTKIVSAGSLPAAGTVPYRDALVAWEVSIALSTGDEPQSCVVYVWGMRDNQWLPAAYRGIGDQVTLRVRSWADEEDRLGRFARAELDDPDFRLLDVPTFFGELIE